MKKILAISGGIDSCVMLHIYRNDPDAIVAHFNHGIRENSRQDELFVSNLAAKYNLPFESRHEPLGPGSSELRARTRRYNFFAEICAQYNGVIYTAHHQDDLCETIAINLHRGTGWRGLVPLDNPAIRRPLLHMTKSDIYRYATQHQLCFRHDSTNTEDTYLRNRIRTSLHLTPDQRATLVALYQSQKVLKTQIDASIAALLPNANHQTHSPHIYQRAWFQTLDDNIAIEILRAALARANLSATRPQLLDFLQAIRTYPSHKHFNLPGNTLVLLTKTTFVIPPR